MEAGRSPSGRAPSSLSFGLVTVLLAVAGLTVFQSFAPAPARPGTPTGVPVALPPMLAVEWSVGSPDPGAARIRQSDAHTALSALVAGRPARYRLSPRVLSQATGMMVSAPISLRPGRYELWLGCVGDGRVRLSIIAEADLNGAAHMDVIERDCVDEDGIYAPATVDPIDGFPAFHPPDSAGLWGREGASAVLELLDGRFQTATVQLSAVAAEPVTVAWRLSDLDDTAPADRVPRPPDGSAP